jgi:hypothetical protein
MLTWCRQLFHDSACVTLQKREPAQIFDASHDKADRDKPHKVVLSLRNPCYNQPTSSRNGMECDMTCRSCGSKNQAEYGAEINIHLPRDRDKAAMLVFPTLVVCLDCGIAEFTVPEAELRRLGERGAASTAA